MQKSENTNGTQVKVEMGPVADGGREWINRLRSRVPVL
jgi:hypothetical protein